MNLEPRIHVIAAALADQSRASMVCALLDGRAFTAKELACTANITPQTASAHLKVLEREGLITTLKAGRNKYMRLASPEVARVIESLAVLTPADHVTRNKPRGATADMLIARSCYDHIAGRLGIALAESLCRQGYVSVNGETFAVTDTGLAFFQSLGVDTAVLAEKKRPMIRSCLDWTERRHHAAGSLAAAVMTLSLEAKWLERQKGSRGLTITPLGRAAFQKHFDICAEGLAMASPTQSDAKTA